MKRSGSSISLIGFTWKTSSIRETVYADLSATECSSQSRGLRDISDANHTQEINFGGCFSRLRRKKCIESIDCYGIPADDWVWFIPFRRGNPEALRATVSAPLFLWARQLVAPIGGSKMLARRSAAAEASAALFL